MKENKTEAVISKYPEERRAFLRTAAKAGFSIPVIATFSMTGLMARPASAMPNMS